MSPLSKYFSGIAAKRLSEVEIHPKKSNQHEFNANKKLHEIFGAERIAFEGTFIYLSDNDESNVTSKGKLTWYDAREKHATRTEYRLYYTANEVIESANVDDLLIIGKTAKNQLAVIIAEKGSTSEKQLLWLFDLEEVLTNKFQTKDFSDLKVDLGYAGKYIVEKLGFDGIEPEENYLDLILGKFGGVFPTTAIFSDFARSLIKDVHPIETPDIALLKWMETEQMLFKTLESYLVKIRLQEGFGKKNDDVEAFIKYSLSIQNRRKSRAGKAFENHIAYILKCNKIKFTAQPITERHSKPDFIFPGIKDYKNTEFNESLLTMLGLKTSAKERWTQVLPEADRIWPKHMITMEPSISKNQTDEMIAKRVQLVIPGEIIKTYNSAQQSRIISFAQFIGVVREKQLRVS